MHVTNNGNTATIWMVRAPRLVGLWGVMLHLWLFGIMPVLVISSKPSLASRTSVSIALWISLPTSILVLMVTSSSRAFALFNSDQLTNAGVFRVATVDRREIIRIYNAITRLGPVVGIQYRGPSPRGEVTKNSVLAVSIRGSTRVAAEMTAAIERWRETGKLPIPKVRRNPVRAGSEFFRVRGITCLMLSIAPLTIIGVVPVFVANLAPIVAASAILVCSYASYLAMWRVWSAWIVVGHVEVVWPRLWHGEVHLQRTEMMNTAGTPQFGISSGWLLALLEPDDRANVVRILQHCAADNGCRR